MRRGLLLAVAAVVALCAVALCQQPVSLTVAPQLTCDACASRSGTVRLGLSATLTYSSFPDARLSRYLSYYEGVRFGTWFLNKNGGLTVQNQALDVQLYTMDNTADNSRAASQMNTLLSTSNVDFFIGDYSGDRAATQFPQAQSLKRVIVGASGASSLSASNPYAFSVINREGSAVIEALDLFSTFIANGEVVAPLKVMIVHLNNQDGQDFKAAVSDWQKANQDKASWFVFYFNPYTPGFFTGISSSEITALGISVRDNKIRAIIGQGSTADVQAITGVLYASNLLLDLQAWAYEADLTTATNQGILAYTRWTNDLSYSSNRQLGVLWGQFQALLHPAVSDRRFLDQYAVSGFHAVMAVAAGVRTANSLDNRRVSAALAAFNSANPITNSNTLLINTPGQSFYFSKGQAIYRPILEQFSCTRNAVLSPILSPPEAANAITSTPFVGGNCYPKQQVIITYSNVGEFALPVRSHTDNAASMLGASVLLAFVACALLLL